MLALNCLFTPNFFIMVVHNIKDSVLFMSNQCNWKILLVWQSVSSCFFLTTGLFLFLLPHRATQSIGMLSFTFLRQSGHDDIIVPMVSAVAAIKDNFRIFDCLFRNMVRM